MLVDRRAPGDVVHAAGALATGTGPEVVGDRCPAPLAPQLPGGLAGSRAAEHALEQGGRALGVLGVGAHAVEAAEGDLGRDLGVLGDERLVRAGRDELVSESLGVGEAQPAVRALRGDVVVGQATLPEVQRRL